MTFLDKLQGLIKGIDLSSLKKSVIKIISDNRFGPFYFQRNVFNINVSPNQSPENIKLAKDIIKELVNVENRILLDASSVKKVHDFKEIESSRGNSELIEYFKDKLPSVDLTIFRAAIYLREVYRRGDKDLARQLKKEISDRHGPRGRNIANLCTAGYFETIIKPLYEEMSKKSEFTLETFQKAYETIVTVYPFAVFISAETKYKDSKQEVIKKIELDKKYGIHKLNIHGIGGDNIKTILKIISELEHLYIDRPKIESDNNQIMATIYF